MQGVEAPGGPCAALGRALARLLGFEGMEARAQRQAVRRPDDVPQGYASKVHRRVIPVNRMAPRSLFNRAFEMLAPPPGQGRLTWIAEHYPSVMAATFRAWRRGANPAPQWARDRLADYLERDAHEKLAVAKMLRSENEKAPD